MISLPILANLNIGYRKAAAPNKGAAAFFYSTDFYDLHCTVLAGIASKKALPLKRTTVPAMAK